MKKNVNLIVSIKQGGQKNWKKIFCFNGEDFSSLKFLAECISENHADDWRENNIRPDQSIENAEWEILENLVNNFLEDSTEDVFDEVTAYG